MTITFASEADARAVFAWDCGALCPFGQAGMASLAAWAEHWMGLMARRDGCDPAAVALVRSGGGSSTFVLSVDGSEVDADYHRRLLKFFDNARNGVQVATMLQLQGTSRWYANWTYFPTHGMPLRSQSHRSGTLGTY